MTENTSNPKKKKGKNKNYAPEVKVYLNSASLERKWGYRLFVFFGVVVLNS